MNLKFYLESKINKDEFFDFLQQSKKVAELTQNQVNKEKPEMDLKYYKNFIEIVLDSYGIKKAKYIGNKILENYSIATSIDNNFKSILSAIDKANFLSNEYFNLAKDADKSPGILLRYKNVNIYLTLVLLNELNREGNNKKNKTAMKQMLEKTLDIAKLI